MTNMVDCNSVWIVPWSCSLPWIWRYDAHIRGALQVRLHRWEACLAVSGVVVNRVGPVPARQQDFLVDNVYGHLRIWRHSRRCAGSDLLHDIARHPNGIHDQQRADAFSYREFQVKYRLQP